MLPFCGTDTGTNLPTQGDYAIDPNRAIGNSPGVASSKLNNKPIRQATFMTSQLAQMVSDLTGADVLDDANTTKLLAIMNAALKALPPVKSQYAAGSTTHYATYYFFIASGDATTGATYTNNGFTYTVSATIAAGVILQAKGTGVPAVSGTLTKSGGTGDSTLTFYAFRKPLYADFEIVGGGGGGGGDPAGVASAGGGGAGGYGRKRINNPAATYAVVIGARGTAGVSGGAAGGNGGNSTLAGMTANGGTGAANTGLGASGGTCSGGDLNVKGGAGTGGDTGDTGTTNGAGGSGGSSYYGGNGGGGYSSAGTAGEYGGGGGGGSNNANGGQGGEGYGEINEYF
jgi:hypothetical protein